MHFVQIGQSAVFTRKIADCLDGRDVAIHRIDGFERHDLRLRRIEFAQQFFQMREIVVTPKPLRAAAALDAFDHRGVIHFVRNDHAVAQDTRQRRQRRVVRRITGREEKGRFLLVKIGKLMFEFDVIMRRAGDVARAAGARSHLVDRPVHGFDHGRVLPHAEIVVGTPHDDVALALGCMECRARERTAMADDVGKDAVTSFVLYGAQRFGQLLLVVDGFVAHDRFPSLAPALPAEQIAFTCLAQLTP